MRSRLLAAGAALALATSLVNGCSKSPTAPVAAATDTQSLVSATLASATSLVDENLAEDATPITASLASSSAGGASVLAAVRPFTWRRIITSETRTWTFAWADTDSTGRPKTCVATLHKHMTGSFVIVPVSAADSTLGDSANIVRKALD